LYDAWTFLAGFQRGETNTNIGGKVEEEAIKKKEQSNSTAASPTQTQIFQD